MMRAIIVLLRTWNAVSAVRGGEEFGRHPALNRQAAQLKVSYGLRYSRFKRRHSSELAFI